MIEKLLAHKHQVYSSNNKNEQTVIILNLTFCDVSWLFAMMIWEAWNIGIPNERQTNEVGIVY